MFFDTQERAQHLEAALKIDGYQKITFEKLIQLAVYEDIGHCLWGRNAVSICEPHRLNEYVRATLKKNEKTMSDPADLDQLRSNITKPNLRPTELADLNELLEANSAWIHEALLAG